MTIGKVCGVAISGGGSVTRQSYLANTLDNARMTGVSTVGSGGAWANPTDYIGLGNISNSDKRCGAWIFRNIAIPSGATISSAYVIFKDGSGGQTNDTIRLKIWANDVAAPVRSTSAATFWALAQTTASVDWDFTTDWASGGEYTTVDIKTVIQELVDSYGAIQDIQIIVWDDGSDVAARRTVAAYASSNLTRLEVTYTG